MNTIKENREISKGEARFIQYTKIALMVIGIVLFWLLVSKIEYIAV